MKKFFKTSLIVLASLFVATLASSFVAASFENAVCIESVDGTALNISLSQSQCKGLYGLLPAEYRMMLDDSYGRFRSKALEAGYGETISVDGIKMTCSQGEGGDIYTISGAAAGFGSHRMSVRVGSRDAFISWMDGVILN